MAIYELYRENILDDGWYQWNQPDKPVPDDNINTAVASIDNIFSTHSSSETGPYMTWTLPEGDDLDDLMDWLNGGGAARMPSLSEWHIYGSGSHGRFCIRKSQNTVYYLNPQIQLYSDIEERRLRFKNYELKDHLGNVRVVFTDLKLSNVFDPLSDYYLFNDNDTPRATKKPFDADLVAISNYYPFGMLQPGLFYSGESYRFGFNGMEKDDKLKGEGNSLDFGARMYDSRVGRFLSIDPLTKSYPMLSPYQFAGNSPIWAVDKNGEYIFMYNNNQNVYMALDVANYIDIQIQTANPISYYINNPDNHLYVFTADLGPGIAGGTMTNVKLPGYRVYDPNTNTFDLTKYNSSQYERVPSTISYTQPVALAPGKTHDVVIFSTGTGAQTFIGDFFFDQIYDPANELSSISDVRRNAANVIHEFHYHSYGPIQSKIPYSGYIIDPKKINSADEHHNAFETNNNIFETAIENNNPTNSSPGVSDKTIDYIRGVRQNQNYKNGTIYQPIIPPNE
ncbi:MAG: RHS repeat-associated core domain-containing protein [bacterium]